MDVRVEQAWYDRPATKVNRAGVWCERHAFADTGDAAVPDRQRGAHLPAAIDELAVYKNQVAGVASLRGRVYPR